MQRIVITGGAGFVGSNLAVMIKQKYPSYSMVCMDNLNRKGSEFNLTKLKDHDIEFIHGDIRFKKDFEQIKGDISCVIDAAAEPSVLAGLDGNTDYLIETNLNGTIHALNFALQKKAFFIFLSTSRIYPIKLLDEIKVVEGPTRFEIAPSQKIAGVSTKGIAENFPLTGARSLYGATKLSSELMIEEFREMFGLKTVVNRCGVLTGPYQMGKIDQGVVVLWMARHIWKKQLTYTGYGGTGKQVRDMLHIKDLFSLIDQQLHDPEKFNGHTVNIGGTRKVSASLQELTAYCEEITGNKINIEPVVENRKADIRLYLSDCSKIRNLAQWEPQTSVKEILEDIFEWIKKDEKKLQSILG